MYGNKVAEIVIPSNPKLMAKLEILDLGYNELAVLPDELDQLKSLRSLKLSNNHVTKVPMRVCEMDLKVIEVASNPVTIPPMETCERGICSMKRYWHCIRMEEQSNSKSKSFVESQKKIQPKSKTTGYGRLMNVMKKASTKSLPSGPPQLRKAVSLGSPEPTAHSSLRNSLPVSIHEEDTDDPQQNEQVDFQASLLMHEARRHGLVKTNSNESFDTGPSESLIEQAEEVSAGLSRFVLEKTVHDQVSINDTLKVIFVGMAMVGKTSMIKRLIEGKEAVVPTCDERTVGVDIYDWEPKNDKRFEHIDSRIEIQDEELRKACGDVDIKFSVWDFAGQHVYHATHELFFSNRSLYVLVWDMGANNEETKFRKISSKSKETGAFKLYDSSDEEDESNNEEDLAAEEEERRANRELEHDIDEKVQFWIDCIQSTSPGAAVLPVASFNDEFDEFESKRRCKVLKQRLLKQEERRVKGIEDRLNELNEQNRADDIAAAQLRKLICPYTRPKLIFGSDDDSVVRVSGTEYTGFDVLTEKIIGIATGKYIGRWKYPLFHGHVGARIPRMRLEVREAVRAMRGRFKVVEWGYFLNSLRDLGLTNIGDISDALHFLTNVGELSYFGGVMQSDPQFANPRKEDSMNCHADEKQSDKLRAVNFGENDDEDADDVDDDERTMLSMDNTSITSPSTNDGYSTSLEEFSSTGLSQYVFLNPRWLVAAVACILRHDLDREIKETRRMVASGGSIQLSHTASFYEAHLNCPVITAEDACMLWQCKRITKKAAERAQEYSNNTSTTPFDFLQAVLIRFGVFVPIDLSIEKVLFGGKEYQQLVHDMNGDADDLAHDPYSGLNLDVTTDAQFFFLPSLLGPCEPLDAWTYKTTDSWKTTLCHSILFPDGVPPGLMERLTASALSSIYAVSNEKKLSSAVEMTAYEGRLVVKEILCWRTAFYVKLGSQTVQPDGEVKESIVEIFSHLTGRDSQCVGSDFMGVGTSRLVTSGRGQIGDGGRRIWNGGYLLVCKCVQRVMSEYSGLEYEKQAFCPDCLAKKAVSEASSWDMSVVRSAVLNSEETLRCQHGHRVDIRFIAGPFDTSHNQKRKTIVAEAGGVPVQDLLGAVVVVGLWDGKTGKVVRVGSGFIADKKRGLIVTAAHTLMNIWGDKKYPFGENYYGLSRGKVVVGVIPREQEGGGKDLAVFRYFAQIVSKDPRLEAGECHIDACILRITTRLENDVGGDGEGCGDEPEIILLNDPKALKSQQLQSLKITEKCELEEPVRIVGYNQGGEGLVGPGESLNRFIDFAKGYVCMKFVHEEDSVNKRKERFKPREEIVVICPTIGGHSGGPCVNQQGEVVGILSRADPAENQRCYLVPASELKVLLNRAKKQL